LEGLSVPKETLGGEAKPAVAAVRSNLTT